MKKRITGIFLLSVMVITLFTACSSGKTNGTSSVAPSASPQTTNTPSKAESSVPEGSAQEHSSSALETAKYELKDFREKIAQTYGEDYIPDRMLTEEEVKERTGITPEMYDEIYAEAATLDENPDVFIGVKAKSGKADEVEKMLNEYKKKMLEDNKYEANREKITAAEIVKQDDYVFMVLLGKNEFGTEGQNIGDAFKNEIKKGADAIRNMFGAK